MNPTGLLVVRAWHEAPGGSLRARISTTSDVTLGTATQAVAASAGELHGVLDLWLASLDGAAAPEEPAAEEDPPRGPTACRDRHGGA